MYSVLLEPNKSYSVLLIHNLAPEPSRGEGEAVAPDNLLAFPNLSPLHFSLLCFPLSPAFFHLWVSCFYYIPSPIAPQNPNALSMSNPLETAGGSQYGANRFSAGTIYVELPRQGWQTQTMTNGSKTYVT